MKINKTSKLSKLVNNMYLSLLLSPYIAAAIEKRQEYTCTNNNCLLTITTYLKRINCTGIEIYEVTFRIFLQRQGTKM